MILFSHIYNEEYLLPFWLNHHKNIFDHGVIIDNFSTDNSIKIINSIVPDWEIHQGVKKFDSELMDNLIMEFESKFENQSKLVLNTTEFLNIKNKSKFYNLINVNNSAHFIKTALMIDPFPYKKVSNLVEDKNLGFWPENINLLKAKQRIDFDIIYSPRDRLIHNYTNGLYHPGRHVSDLKSIYMDKKIANIYWYAFSPWNQEFKKRKLQIQETISDRDIEKNFSFQHFKTNEEIEKQYSYLVKYAHEVNKKISVSKKLYYLYLNFNLQHLFNEMKNELKKFLKKTSSFFRN
jgi:hypothetical protein